jgi:hypothetical protein
MSQSWFDFTVVDIAPSSGGYERLNETTWDLFYAWTAGPEWVLATPDRVTPQPVRRVNEREDGAMEYWDEPFTAEHQAEIDDDLDSDLAAVGLPPRPRGLDWYLRLTPSQHRAFRDFIGGKIEQGLPGASSEQEYLAHIHKAMSALVPEAIRYAITQDQEQG